MSKISEFRYEIPSDFAICEECWEEEATHWGDCASCYWKKELDSEAIQSVWDYDIPEEATPSNFDFVSYGGCLKCGYLGILDGHECNIPELLHTCHASTGTCKRCEGGYNY